MKTKYLLGSLALALGLLTAKADIIPSLSSIAADGTGFRWNYSVNVTVDQMVVTGDFFTIYDFGSIRPGSNVQPANWVFSTSLTGVTPPGVLPTDNPNLLNLTWTYVGTTPIVGQAFLGIFSAVSSTNQISTANFAAQATRSTGPQAGTKISNIGLVSVPVPEMSALAPIIGVCGLGFIGVFSSMLRRRNAS
ncbi:MAG: hypothetical protein M3Z22_03365 [Verrucomicrobiota bacterium]|nr:hypothetical protein [Verrucomicrobiota bacterium]